MKGITHIASLVIIVILLSILFVIGSHRFLLAKLTKVAGSHK